MSSDVTTDRAAEAALFCRMLRVDPNLSADWSNQIAAARALPKKDGGASLDDFLRAQGYACTFQDVAAALEADVPMDEIPNWDARRFAVDVIANSKLRNGWSAALREASKSETPELGVVDRFLDRSGYRTTTKQVVRAQGDQQQGAGLALWMGVYGNTTLQKDGESVADPPVLIVSNDSVTLGKDQILGFRLEGTVLSWDRGDLNDTAGNLVFRNVAVIGQDGSAYTGPELGGTLTYPEGGSGGVAYPIKGQGAFSGRLGKPAQKESTPPGFSQTQIDWIVGLSGIVAMVMTSAQLASLYMQWRDYRGKQNEQRRQGLEHAFDKASKDDIELQERSSKKTTTLSYEPPPELDRGNVSEITTLIKQAENSPDPEVAARFDKERQTAEQRAREQFVAEDDRSRSDDEEMGDDLREFDGD